MPLPEASFEDVAVAKEGSFMEDSIVSNASLAVQLSISMMIASNDDSVS